MKAIHFFLFIVTLPILIVLGHDLYLFYVAQGEQLDPDLATKLFTEERPGRGFDFAALGFIWTKYSPETFSLMKDSYTAEEWAVIQEYLKLPAFYVAVAFAVVMYLLAALVVIFKGIKEKSQKVSKRKKAKMR